MKYFSKHKYLKLHATIKGNLNKHYSIIKESAFHTFQTSNIATKSGKIKSRNNRIATIKGLLKLPMSLLQEILFNPFKESDISLITGKNKIKTKKYTRKIKKNS